MDGQKNNLTSGRLPSHSERAATGIAGLDVILAGGLTTHRLYLVEGTPGTGKTTTSICCVLSALHHARTIHEFRLSASQGLQIGAPLQDFEGIMGGLPSYRGKTPMLNDAG